MSDKYEKQTDGLTTEQRKKLGDFALKASGEAAKANTKNNERKKNDTLNAVK